MVKWNLSVERWAQKFMLLPCCCVVNFQVSFLVPPFYVSTFQFNPVIIGSLSFALSALFLSVYGGLLAISPLKRS